MKELNLPKHLCLVVFLLLILNSYSQNNSWVFLKGDTAQGYGASWPPDQMLPYGGACGGSWKDGEGNLWLFGAGTTNYLWKYEVASNRWLEKTGMPGKRNGVYGSKGSAGVGNSPGNRSRAFSWSDASGNLWLYGGYGYDAVSSSLGYLSDLWKYDISTNLWTWVGGDSLRNQPTNLALGILGSKAGALAWNDKQGNAWLYGGEGWRKVGNNTNYYSNSCDMWKFSIATNSWSIVKDTACVNSQFKKNIFGYRRDGVSWTDSAGNFWAFGGIEIGHMSDLWKYERNTNRWTWISGDTTGDKRGVYGIRGKPSASSKPGGRKDATGWADSSGNLWLFGGYGYARDGIGHLNDLWRFNIATSTWSWISGDSVRNKPSNYSGEGEKKPGGRSASVGWMRNDSLWLWGGNGYIFDGTLKPKNDLWKYAKPATIGGTVYDVHCNSPLSTPDNLQLSASLQKMPIKANAIVQLFYNGSPLETVEVDTEGRFEFKRPMAGNTYSVEIRYVAPEYREYFYRYDNVKSGSTMEDILIPDSLTRELAAFKTLLGKRCFTEKMGFLQELESCSATGFNLQNYEGALHPFMALEGVVSDHRKHVDNLANYYVSLATVYTLGGYSTKMVNKTVNSIFDAVESIAALYSFNKVAKSKKVNTKRWNSNVLRTMREAIMAKLESQSNESLSQATKDMYDNIKLYTEDILKFIEYASEYGVAGGAVNLGVDAFKKKVALTVSSIYYDIYTKSVHSNFIPTASAASKKKASEDMYQITYDKLFNGGTNSIRKLAIDTFEFRSSNISFYTNAGNYATVSANLLDAGVALALIPGGQAAAAISKSLSVAAKGLSVAYFGTAVYNGIMGTHDITTLSTNILPTSGLQAARKERAITQLSNISIEGLASQKEIYNEKLTQFASIVNTPFDSASFYQKYLELADEDSLYNVRMSETLNSFWACNDSASVKVPGYANRLKTIMDSFVTKQYTLRSALHFENLAYIFDAGNSTYTTEINNLTNSIKTLNDSAVNGLHQLAELIIEYSVVAPAFLAQESFTLLHTHTPGSSGSVSYTFKNYGAQPLGDVWFKIKDVTNGYAITSPDSIFVGDVESGGIAAVTYNFSSPLHDSIGRYQIEAISIDRVVKRVSGSLYVNDPQRYYSAKDGNWNSPDTWTTGIVPDINSNVYISHNIVVDTEATCRTITMEVPGSVKIAPGKSLVVTQ